MGHNPPRPKSIETDAIKRIADEIARRPIPCADFDELADRMEARVKQGKKVVLLPETALIVAKVLRRAKGKDA